VSRNAPLIATVALDPPAQAFFDALRRRHFPPDRNVLDAHVTAFHALPGEHRDRVIADLDVVAPRAPLPVHVTGVRFLGRGAAYALEGAEVQALRGRLADLWSSWLTPQDQQPWRPHVTVQNKADPARARALHEELLAGFSPWAVTAVGLALWEYRGGPWAAVCTRRFES
jgi:2'-5' RNA ligase